MKKRENSLQENKKEKERQRVLNNFYTKKIKNGKGPSGNFLDEVFLGLIISLILIFLIYKLIKNFIISVIIGITIITLSKRYLKDIREKNRLIKIEKIKKEYKVKLDDEGLIAENEDIEDYIIKRYYEKKDELKSNINFLGKDKIYKLYFLSIIFYIASYFVTYAIYYKIMSILSFILATFIGSYNLVEYMRKKDEEDLLNKDI